MHISQELFNSSECESPLLFMVHDWVYDLSNELEDLLSDVPRLEGNEPLEYLETHLTQVVATLMGECSQDLTDLVLIEMVGLYYPPD